MKYCYWCKEIKDSTDFYKSKARKDGFQTVCKSCQRAYGNKNPDVIHRAGIKYRLKHHKEILAKSREQKRKKYAREYYLANKTAIKDKQKMYNQSHKKQRNLRLREKYKNDNFYRLNINISSAINATLKKGKSGVHWESAVGYTINELKTHLESVFRKEMNWDNYGSYWHIDHRIPISHWKFNSYEDKAFIACWSLGNLQPLEASENRRKHNCYWS